MASDGIILVCASAEASPFMVPGSDFTRFCSKCRGRLMIAPSGQKLLADNPAATLLCVNCVRQDLTPEQFIELPLDVDATIEEMKSAVPNTWRSRN